MGRDLTGDDVGDVAVELVGEGGSFLIVRREDGALESELRLAGAGDGVVAVADG